MWLGASACRYQTWWLLKCISFQIWQFCVSNRSVFGSFSRLPQEGKERKTIVKTPSSGHRDSAGESQGGFLKKTTNQVIQSDLFGMVSDPFKGLSDLQLGDTKVTLNHQECVPGECSVLGNCGWLVLEVSSWWKLTTNNGCFPGVFYFNGGCVFHTFL